MLRSVSCSLLLDLVSYTLITIVDSCAGFISKSRYNSLKEDIDAEYKEKMQAESANRKAAEDKYVSSIDKLREELERERAKNAALQGKNYKSFSIPKS